MSMITTSISITPYLAEYLRGKYNNGSDEPFRIPDNTDLYHVIWTLMSRRHQNQSPIDDGNLTIILPERRIGKDPGNIQLSVSTVGQNHRNGNTQDVQPGTSYGNGRERLERA